MSNKKIVLAIGGSDNCSGAGIQADLKTCQALGTYCVTTLTAVTAQNDFGVRRVGYVGAQMLREQLEATLEVVTPEAVKIGMLPNAESAIIIAEIIQSHALRNIVLDPVMAATSGGSLTEKDGFINTLRTKLLPLCTLVTPNIPELDLLLSEEEESPYKNLHEMDIATVSTFMKRNKVKNLLLKGGHANCDKSIDYLYTNNLGIIPASCEKLESPRISTRNTHGTGCTLSSAIASYLALGNPLPKAVRKAKAYIDKCIQRAVECTVFPKYGPLEHNP